MFETLGRRKHNIFKLSKRRQCNANLLECLKTRNTFHPIDRLKEYARCGFTDETRRGNEQLFIRQIAMDDRTGRSNDKYAAFIGDQWT